MERFANKFKQFGTRVVLGRFGLILSDDGGALEMMELPYRLYVGENSALEDNGTLDSYR